MKVAPKVLLTVGLIVLSNSATAQQNYSFEDACRKAGMTTGACAPNAQKQYSLGCVPITGSAFHAEKSTCGRCIETTLSPVIDAEILVEMIGLPNVARINDLRLTIGRSTACNNAFALFYKGSRMIILDPAWARSMTAEAYLVLGHEAGHHICGHVLDGDPLARKKQELEADQFSGMAIRNFEAYHGKPFFSDALQAAVRLYADTQPGPYPSRQNRLEAIKTGYESGSPCGNLAPPIRGYSASPR